MNDPDQPTYQSYTFATFQELVQRVPTRRIRACLDELASILTSAKAVNEMMVQTAIKQGINVPPDTGIELPAEGLTWDDDGKGILTANMMGNVDGEMQPLLTITHKPATA